MLVHRTRRRGLRRNMRRGFDLLMLLMFLRKEKPTEYAQENENNKDPHTEKDSRARATRWSRCCRHASMVSNGMNVGRPARTAFFGAVLLLGLLCTGRAQ